MLYLLSQIIDQAATRQPEKEAIRFAGESLTYETLVRESGRLAAVLVEEGVRRGDRVGLYLNKGLASAVALYGIMKAGAAYVPLDPTAPVARVAHILKDCDIRVLVTEESRLPAVRRLHAEGADFSCLIGLPFQDDLPVSAIPWSEVAQAPSDPVLPRVIEQDLAYILYTSGSTGVPKGVVHTHRSALSWAEVSSHTYGLCPDDRVSNHAPLHFDLSTLDFFATAVAGATTVVVPELYTKFPASLSDLMEKERLTVLYVVPFALTQLLHYGALERRDLRALRWVLFGGEPIPPRHLRRLMALWPHARFSNVYGPTETNGVTYYLVPPPPEGSDEPIPIGGLFENVEALVVDANDQPVAPGEPGELLVRTPTMMRGYWADAALNERAFYRRQAFGHHQDLFHRTGDLVQQRPDGDFLFLGRKDRQIKTRGYRVELDEVEAALAAHAGLAAAAVYSVADEDSNQHIEAAVILRNGTDHLETLTPTLLREHLTTRLPIYAVPEKIVILPEFPQTSTGKVDRRQLVAQAVGRKLESASDES